MNKIILLTAALQKLIELLNNHSINYWIDFGTLLGAVRNKSIIPWDTDADISIIHTEAPRLVNLIYSELILNKNIIKSIKCFANGGIELLLFDDSIHIDIYPWKIDGDITKYNTYYSEEKSDFGLPFFPTKEIEVFYNIQFLNLPTRIPVNYHDRLVRLYGDYMTPVEPDRVHGVYWTGAKIDEHTKRLSQKYPHLFKK